jgi:hypothetical protein
MLVPLVNVITLFAVAFLEWPALKKSDVGGKSV